MYSTVHTNVSRVMEFKIQGVLKHQDFGPRIKILQENCCILRIDLMPSPKNIQNHTFEVNCQKLTFFFSCKNINLDKDNGA